MEGPPLGPGGEDITWPDQVAPRGRKASSTRKIKPQDSNLSATIFSTVRLVFSREPCQYKGPHSFKPQYLCQAESPQCQCLLHFLKRGASRDPKTSVSGASAPSV